ncbi:UNVERIFIED_CONTAM: hypothetical protein HHA_450520 [Hammondia hammondi]|eukprot:XP_008882859.1 hypothetical protein HHA_450520 [Hammondia hammondi]
MAFNVALGKKHQSDNEASSFVGPEDENDMVPLSVYFRASREFQSEHWEMLLSLLTDAFVHFERFFHFPFGGEKLDILFLPHDLSPLSYATDGVIVFRDTLLDFLLLSPPASPLLDSPAADDLLSAVHTLYRVTCGLWVAANPCRCSFRSSCPRRRSDLHADASSVSQAPSSWGSVRRWSQDARSLNMGARKAAGRRDRARSEGDADTWWGDSWIPDAIAIYLATEALSFARVRRQEVKEKRDRKREGGAAKGENETGGREGTTFQRQKLPERWMETSSHAFLQI